jgi:DNA-dependent RNA polymerase auxiliary subunit epsilon
VASVVYSVYGSTTTTVTPLAPGTATITVTTNDGGYTTTCTVTIVSRPSSGGGGGRGSSRDSTPAPNKKELYENVSAESKEQLKDIKTGAELKIEVGAKDLPPVFCNETLQKLAENQNNLAVDFEKVKVSLNFASQSLLTGELQKAGENALMGISAAIVEGEAAQTAVDFAVSIGGEVLRAYDFSITVVGSTGDEEGTQVHHLNGAVTVTLDLSDMDLTEIDTNQLTIQHQQPDGTWLELQSVFDPETKTLTFTTDRFSMFAVVEKPAAPGTIKLTVGQTNVDVDGTIYELDAVPYIRDKTNRTMVPLRFISEALETKVEWQAETRRVLIKDGATEITLTIDSDQVLVNETTVTLYCRAELKPPGRTFVPLRFVSETLGAQVDYDKQTKQITITRIIK